MGHMVRWTTLCSGFNVNFNNDGCVKNGPSMRLYLSLRPVRSTTRDRESDLAPAEWL